MSYKNLNTFKFWCQKVLPLVYDDSLSYYEVLCKVVKYINDLIENDKIIGDELTSLQSELAKVNQWIKNYDTSFAEEIIKSYLVTMIFVEISDSGYIIYYIPENWTDIQFNTTGLDVIISDMDYGRLVLSY